MAGSSSGSFPRWCLRLSSPSGPCPTTVRLEESHQPYREGSYKLVGRASLREIASGWRQESRDAFSATWAAPLRPAYQWLRFEVGQLRLILDMTDLRDPNGPTPSILSVG